jgi:hypothetical protein
MKIIPLTQGKNAIVDDDDYEWLSQWKWHAAKIRNVFYVARKIRVDGVVKTILMHREISKPPTGMQIDHINGDPLDNRRENLRICTNTDNQRNRPIHKDNISGFKGVRPRRGNNNKYEAYIFHNGKQIYLGKYEDINLAAQAYDNAAKFYHGGFASLNFKT